MKLEIEKKNVYGVDRFYPSNDTAHKFAKLIGLKTFSLDHLKQIKDLGYEIVQVQDALF